MLNVELFRAFLIQKTLLCESFKKLAYLLFFSCHAHRRQRSKQADRQTDRPETTIQTATH